MKNNRNDKEKRLELVKSMHNIIVNLSDETAYYGVWIYTMPDNPNDDDFHDFANDEAMFNALVNDFNFCMKNYLQSGIYVGNTLYEGK